MAGRIVFFIALFAASTFAQLNSVSPSLAGSVRVHVVFENGTPCDSFTHVTMAGRNGNIAEGFADSHCMAEFRNVPPGNYRLLVSAQGVPNTDTGAVTIDSVATNDLEVKVNRTGEAARNSSMSVAPFVAAVDLSIPASAAKEF